MRTLSSALIVIAGLAGAVSLAKGSDLQPGDPAPAFSLKGSDGKTYDLAALKGRTVVLAWFPKAFTGG